MGDYSPCLAHNICSFLSNNFTFDLLFYALFITCWFVLPLMCTNLVIITGYSATYAAYKRWYFQPKKNPEYLWLMDEKVRSNGKAAVKVNTEKQLMIWWWTLMSSMCWIFHDRGRNCILLLEVRRDVNSATNNKKGGKKKNKDEHHFLHSVPPSPEGLMLFIYTVLLYLALFAKAFFLVSAILAVFGSILNIWAIFW